MSVGREFLGLWRWWAAPLVVLLGGAAVIAVWSTSRPDSPIVYETVPGPPP